MCVHCLRLNREMVHFTTSQNINEKSGAWPQCIPAAALEAASMQQFKQECFLQNQNESTWVIRHTELTNAISWEDSPLSGMTQPLYRNGTQLMLQSFSTSLHTTRVHHCDPMRTPSTRRTPPHILSVSDFHIQATTETSRTVSHSQKGNTIARIVHIQSGDNSISL